MPVKHTKVQKKGVKPVHTGVTSFKNAVIRAALKEGELPFTAFFVFSAHTQRTAEMFESSSYEDIKARALDEFMQDKSMIAYVRRNWDKGWTTLVYTHRGWAENPNFNEENLPKQVKALMLIGM